MNAQRMWVIYSGIVSIGLATSLASGAIAESLPQKASFREIDVQRINLREPDGTLRMVLTNTANSPGMIMKGKETAHPSGNRGAGMYFFNEEGTENGGLVFRGKRGPDGKVSAGGHFSFDQYEQDQVIQLSQGEANGTRFAGMSVNDRPDAALNLAVAAELGAKLKTMKPGPEAQALIDGAWDKGLGVRPRLYVGKTGKRDSVVILNDALGRARITMKVTPEGKASIDFHDDKGGTIHSVSPDNKVPK